MNNIYIDELRYFIGDEDYVINEYITIHNPSVREVKSFGESDYHSVVNIFTRKPYDVAVELYDDGVDYQSITDWDLFYDTIINVPIKYTSIFFGDIDFTRFGRYVNQETGMKYLVHEDNNNFVIDEVIYRHIVTYLRYIHFISEKVEYDVGNNMAKKFLIERMRRKQKKLLQDYATGKKKRKSQISDMIRYCVNNANFKYDYSSVMDIKLCLLYDSYYFITHNNERDNVMSGIYHGTIDASKMKDKSILNVIPDLHK